MAEPKSVPARDFTVGWVCALPVELAAAAEMMDEELADLPSLPTDSNLYSFGRIGVHNVVAACLPAGQMGTNSAAAVASQMQQSFPSLRFGVLVGIGGGVPRLDDEIDIRLGDVVISQPTGQYGGVVQYDFGKTGPDGRIARTGSLNAPPTILLNALAKLRANDLRGKTQARLHLSKLTCQPNFVSPGSGQDSLYDASSAHIAGATCAKCRPDDVLDREIRATTDPVLFFGTIASGNQVMKDGPTRDRYSRELGGVLCFEMEAAGLMNSFPCLVVRGICDYADAHKNKRWQPYAAATAAAYAKELLSIIPPLSSGDMNGSKNSHRKPNFLVPFSQNENFVGREDILSQLLERLPPSAQPNACQRTVIEGLGGIGKTQVAIEAAYCVRQAHPDCSVFWVPAVDMTMFENAYREIGRALEVKGIEDDKADVTALVKAALGRDGAGPWLLIIDNVDDIVMFTHGQLLSYLPFSQQGSILFTTRNHQAAVRFDTHDVIRLKELDEAEACKLLHQRLQARQIGNLEDTTKLLHYLTHLPLAIRQASAYIATNTEVTVLKYLRYCKSSDQSMITMLSRAFDDRDRYQTIQNPIATTWLVSFREILRDAPLAARYLRSIAYFAEKDIPVSLLSAEENEIERDEAISTLRAYAFILDRSRPDRFDVHRLVRLVMRNWVQTQGEQRQQITDIVWRISEKFPWPTHETRDMWTCYLPHAQSVLGFGDQCNEKETLGSLQHNVAECYDLLGRYSEAEEMHRQTLGLRETVLGHEHPETLGSMNNLALVLDSQGKYSEAEEMHRQTLGLKETVLGREHPSTLDSINALAIVLDNQGKHEEAVQKQGQALTGYRIVLGDEHPRTLESMNNLANVLDRQGKYSEAEKMHRQTLGLRETVLGREHPETLASMNNLALVLDSQGKYAEAEEMHRQTLGLKETVLGREHPSTLDSINALAIVLDNQGKHEEAVQKQGQALTGYRIVLGDEHPRTLESMNNLANVLDRQGKYSEAEKMHRQTLGLRETVLGRKHPSTLDSMMNIGNVLYSQGKYSEAEEMHRQTLGLKETVLGHEHPSTLDSINNLALVLNSQGKYSEAEEMHREELRLCGTVLGREHPSTLDSINNLALVLNSQGKYSEAEEMHRQTLGLRETVLGREHPSTLASMNNLALVLDSQGKYSEAEEMHRQTLGLRETVLGREHPSTLTSMNNLALVLGKQGKYSEAEEMHRQTLGLRETVLGREHPSTLASMNNLALVLDSQGKYSEAEEMHRQTLGLRETVLGREHPSTLASMNNLALVLDSQGKYSEAEEMHRQTLGLRETVLGREHPSTLTSMNNLALVLGKQGKYSEAEEMHRQTLGLRETVLGHEHPSTLTSINNLALVLDN